MNLVTSERWLESPREARPWRPEADVAFTVMFDSVTEFTEAAAAQPSRPHGRTESRDADDGRWYGTRTFDEAVDLQAKGWHDGADRISALTADITATAGLISPQAYVEYVDADGHALDVERYLTGDPEHWMEIHERYVDNPGGRVFRIMFCSSVSSGISAEAMVGRGAAVAALVLLLEERGHPCEVVSYVGGHSGNVSMLAGCYVKRAGDPLSALGLAFPVAHPSMMRRFGLSMMEQLPPRQAEQITSDGYGRPTTAPPQWQTADVHIGRAMFGEEQWQNTASAAAWVVKQLRELGVIEGDV